MGSPYIRIRKGNAMAEASEDLSVAKLFAEREERGRRDREAVERFQRRKEEELAAYKQRLETVHLVDEMIPAQLERLKHAFERGESELMVKVSCQSSAVLRKKPQRKSGSPPMR